MEDVPPPWPMLGTEQATVSMHLVSYQLSGDGFESSSVEINLSDIVRSDSVW